MKKVVVYINSQGQDAKILESVLIGLIAHLPKQEFERDGHTSRAWVDHTCEDPHD